MKIVEMSQEDFDDGRQWIIVKDEDGNVWEEWRDWPEYTHETYYYLCRQLIDPDIIYGVIKRVAKLYESTRI